MNKDFFFLAQSYFDDSINAYVHEPFDKQQKEGKTELQKQS